MFQERLEERVKKEKYVGVNELNNLLKNEIIEMLSSLKRRAWY
ncbi:hypothetical protein N9K77_01860 [bacterium]|nr:hypothetical protein [bacterium]